MTVGVLLLAAGSATRFGADKRLAEMPDGRSVLDATLAAIVESDLPILVCVADRDDELARALRERDIACLRCARAGEGMGSTLAVGIGAIPGWSGVLVALADMPWIAPATYRCVSRQLSEQHIVVPVFDGRRGHPVGFGRAFYTALSSLAGDTGAREVLARYSAQLTEVALTDAAILRDIDVPNDLSQFTSGCP
jgi:molybdenum cofactor cytidylyltransferase